MGIIYLEGAPGGGTGGGESNLGVPGGTKPFTLQKGYVPL
jgi:hypothetical protein